MLELKLNHVSKKGPQVVSIGTAMPPRDQYYKTDVSTIILMTQMKYRKSYTE